MRNILSPLDGFGSPFGRRLGATTAWSPALLFANGEEGLYWDLEDFSTMFQDSAGTTPVTAVEQSVALVLDKSKGLTLGAELGAVGNWTLATGWSVVGSTLVQDGTGSGGAASINLVVTTGKTYLVTATVAVTSGVGTITFRDASTDIPVGTTNVSSGTYTFREYFTGAVNILPNSFIGNISNISVKELPGNHASQATAASRPVLRQEAGGQYYLAFDGTDDSLATAAIDFSATDEMSVFAGVRKLANITGVIAETSTDGATNNGSIMLQGPRANSDNYAFGSNGTTQRNAISSASSYVAPITNVVTCTSDISGDDATLYVDGVQAAQSTSDQGTGNYGNYPLYIGRRGGTTLPFNGRLYSLIVRGKTSTAEEITAAEAWVASKTGVTL